MTTLITASIIAFGIFGFSLLPVSALPQVDFPTIAVTATLPGASAETMAASVAGVIERQLSTIAGISIDVIDHPSQGTTPITIQFDLNRNIDSAALDVQTALTIAQRRLADRDEHPAELPEGQSGRFAVLFWRSTRDFAAAVRRSTNMARSLIGADACRRFTASPRWRSSVRRNSRFASRPIRRPPAARGLSARRYP